MASNTPKRVIHLVQNPESENPDYMAAENFNISKAAHPVACVIHLLFKATGVLCYFFCGLFTSSNVMVFITVLISSCLDFWITKNVTGRLLIGLRWWNAAELLPEDFENNNLPNMEKLKITKTGTNMVEINNVPLNREDDSNDSSDEFDPQHQDDWYFESYDINVSASFVDANVFWWSQAANSIFWGIFLVLKVTSLQLFWVRKYKFVTLGYFDWNSLLFDELKHL